MTGTVLVASDLDRTLIYSAAALDLPMPDAEAPRLLCVEVYEGRPLSFVTQSMAGRLEDLAARALFVPATTRNRAQYARVHLPGPPPPYAICANGGHLLVDGEPDAAWHARVLRAIADGCAPPAEIAARLDRDTGDAPWLLKRRVEEGLFEFLVVDRELLPETWLKEFTGWADERGWSVSLQGRKLYAVPRPLTKAAAVAEVVRRTGAGRVLTAGDSLLDADLLLAGDRAWRPAHGELAARGWPAADTAPHVTALPERGVAAGERILGEMVREVDAWARMRL